METTLKIENASHDAAEVAALLEIVRQAFLGGAPDGEVAANGLEAIVKMLERISADLDAAVGEIYQGELLADEEKADNGGKRED